MKNVETLLGCIVISLSINHYRRRLSSRVQLSNIKEGLIDPAPEPERTLAAEQELDMLVKPLSSVRERVCRIFLHSAAALATTNLYSRSA